MTLDEARRAFAEEIEAVAHLEAPELVDAFARVPREAFLGPGPWQISRLLDTERPYRTTPDADPRRIYHDVVVAIDPARQLNNGQPSALARWICEAAIRRGDARRRGPGLLHRDHGRARRSHRARPCVRGRSGAGRARPCAARAVAQRHRRGERRHQPAWHVRRDVRQRRLHLRAPRVARRARARL